MTEYLHLMDLSHLPRFGVKGPAAVAWLQSQGISVPDRPNSWKPLSDGGLVARLGLNEFLLEGSAIAPQLAQACQPPPPRVYPVLRQDRAICLRGRAVQELLRQTCNVNFRALDLNTHPVILTTLIGVSVTVIPGEQAGLPFYRIWCDGTFGTYFWSTLAEITAELGGRSDRTTQSP
ncbi:hypothetical protein BST81_01225 [Leptolyngbya sp. 'hensonii']|uniref:hypothetical protein n=1 Tax=Leptolyngbya sp. 'hensonii' TaxID=1922337 RepID=UPI00094FE45E|nr:hypothetical protein [Leptolyngbya sp. 'hensonii']OLP20379.1 hypothetical protein BST81_01225 [Leptolyngbya sp. 'hensonii']